MGGGASKNDVENKHKIEENVFLMIKKCMKSLPFPEGVVTEEMIRKVSITAERIDLLSNQDIIKKGQRAVGIYIIQKGMVQVLSSTSEVLVTLLPGDYFGEISTLFYIPCTAHVRSQGKALMILLKSDHLRIALNDTVVKTDLFDYYVERHYLDTNGTLSQPELMHVIAVNVLKQVPLFQNWAESAIESLIQKTETDSYGALVIFPAGSMIQQIGQPADEITVITRGSVEIYDAVGGCITEFNANRWPLWIGEEVLHYMNHNSTYNVNGLYSGSERCASLKAVSVCQALIIKYSHIVDIAQRYKSCCGLALRKTLEQWSKLYECWNKEVFEKHQPYLQMEILLKQLGDSAILQDVPVSFLYSLVMNSVLHEYQEGTKVVADKHHHRSSMKRNSLRRKSLKRESKRKLLSEQHLEPGKIYASSAHEKFQDDDRFLLLVSGVIQVNLNEKGSRPVLERGQLFYISASKMKQCSVLVKSSAILLRLTGTMFFDTCQHFPNAVLTLPTTSSR